MKWRTKTQCYQLTTPNVPRKWSGIQQALVEALPRRCARQLCRRAAPGDGGRSATCYDGRPYVTRHVTAYVAVGGVGHVKARLYSNGRSATTVCRWHVAIWYRSVAAYAVCCCYNHSGACSAAYATFTPLRCHAASHARRHAELLQRYYTTSYVTNGHRTARQR
jgi:hypothetical protein